MRHRLALDSLGQMSKQTVKGDLLNKSPFKNICPYHLSSSICGAAHKPMRASYSAKLKSQRRFVQIILNDTSSSHIFKPPQARVFNEKDGNRIVFW